MLALFYRLFYSVNTNLRGPSPRLARLGSLHHSNLVVAREHELAQHRRARLQRLSDGLCTTRTNVTGAQVELGQHRRVRLEGIGDGLGAGVADVIAAQAQVGQPRVKRRGAAR